VAGGTLRLAASSSGQQKVGQKAWIQPCALSHDGFVAGDIRSNFHTAVKGKTWDQARKQPEQTCSIALEAAWPQFVEEKNKLVRPPSPKAASGGGYGRWPWT
jgi:hypothetical protein